MRLSPRSLPALIPCLCHHLCSFSWSFSRCLLEPSIVRTTLSPLAQEVKTLLSRPLAQKREQVLQCPPVSLLWVLHPQWWAGISWGVGSRDTAREWWSRVVVRSGWQDCAPGDEACSAGELWCHSLKEGGTLSKPVSIKGKGSGALPLAFFFLRIFWCGSFL